MRILTKVLIAAFGISIDNIRNEVENLYKIIKSGISNITSKLFILSSYIH